MQPISCARVVRELKKAWAVIKASCHQQIEAAIVARLLPAECGGLKLPPGSHAPTPETLLLRQDRPQFQPARAEKPQPGTFEMKYRLM
mmetsp:Transcript_3644/g.6553  ORF Transcript_3644/g.6553 Transcript_3644/m.6553 type:complete len:88 (-) Transcript_3644:164-427(-)